MRWVKWGPCLVFILRKTSIVGPTYIYIVDVRRRWEKRRMDVPAQATEWNEMLTPSSMAISIWASRTARWCEMGTLNGVRRFHSSDPFSSPSRLFASPLPYISSQTCLASVGHLNLALASSPTSPNMVSLPSSKCVARFRRRTWSKGWRGVGSGRKGRRVSRSVWSLVSLEAGLEEECGGRKREV